MFELCCQLQDLLVRDGLLGLFSSPHLCCCLLDTGVLLPELVLSMILLQAYHPSVAQKSEGMSLLRDLLIPIDGFNRLAPGSSKEDQVDMAWLSQGTKDGSGKVGGLLFISALKL